MIARMQGMPAIGYGSPTKWYFTLNAILREYVGYLKLTWKENQDGIGVVSQHLDSPVNAALQQRCKSVSHEPVLC